ncbi:hypothetical protein NIES4074_63430 (plasmid) [Cylindrospermum sp. NIES-4074]|nr:hypothetical protein NIES4074_63430 [Cylindrospermum sp. NIES-4074]
MDTTQFLVQAHQGALAQPTVGDRLPPHQEYKTNVTMSTLIPSFNSCSAEMTPGERRLAQRLEEKLEDDYSVWYDVPIGKNQFR